MHDLVTRELERVIHVHLTDGVEIGRAPVARSFRYRFRFDDLGTSVDCEIDSKHVRTTTRGASSSSGPTHEPQATVRLSATKLSHMFIIARQGVFDPEAFDRAAFAELGFLLEGDLDLHCVVLALVGGAPSHFQAALDAIDLEGATAEDPARFSVRYLQHTSRAETEEAARTALRESRPLLVRGFPFSWTGITREDFLATHGALDVWVEGRLLPLEVYADRAQHESPPREAYSPVNPTDAVYATNLVSAEALARTFGSPLFEDRCGPPRIFGGRSVLPDPAAWSRVTRPHRHAHDVLAWQVFGRKKWILMPPAHGTPLELRALGFDTQFCGVLDPDLVEDAAFQAAATPIVMEPGELLVLPGGWFHVTYVTGEPALGFSAFARDDVLRFV
jgi:hypothetical protein